MSLTARVLSASVLPMQTKKGERLFLFGFTCVALGLVLLLL